jgi:hypothetical protein
VLTSTVGVVVIVVVVRPKATEGRRIIIGAEAPKASARPKRHDGLSEKGARRLSVRGDIQAQQPKAVLWVRAGKVCEWVMRDQECERAL